MFNEEVGAQNCVISILDELGNIQNQSMLIVVNDGSSDGTRIKLAELKKAGLNFISLDHDVNKGYGKALQTGIAVAIKNDCDYILFMDSDLTNHPNDIPAFVEQMHKNIDIIKATRYSNGGRVEGVPLYRWIISWFGNKFAKFLFQFQITDSTNGFRAVKSKLLKDIDFKENDFSIIMEELYLTRRSAKSHVNVPVKLTNRSNDLRKSSFSYKPEIFIKYLKYPVKYFIQRK